MSPDLDLVLRQADLRVTPQRLAVLQAVYQEGKHERAETIVALARKAMPSLSRQAVYDNLNTLVAAGVLRRIEPAGRPALYEARVGDNHHHLVCRRCFTAVDIECVIGAAPCLTPEQTHDFVIDEAEVVFWGVCPSCQRQPDLQDNPSHVN